MSVWLLAPAAASVLALAVFVLLLRSTTQAVRELRDQLMLMSATAVAGEELVRATSRMADHATNTHAAANQVRTRLGSATGHADPSGAAHVMLERLHDDRSNRSPQNSNRLHSAPAEGAGSDPDNG